MITIQDLYNIVGNKIANETGKAIIRNNFPPQLAERMCAAIDGQERPVHHKLNVFQLMAIYNVCFSDELEVKPDLVNGLVDEGLLLRSKRGKVSMAKGYQNIYAEIHSTKNVNWLGALKSCAAAYNNVITRKTYMEFLPDWISVDRVRYVLSKLETMGVLKREGIGKGTKYMVIKLKNDIEL